MQPQLQRHAACEYEADLSSRAEEVAFRQATLISVISEVVKESLVARKVDRAQDPGESRTAPIPISYAPGRTRSEQAASAPSSASRRPIGSIGFSGTFGGWHGIDVLAAAIPRICEKAPAAKFLLIGDGSHKPMLDEAVPAPPAGSRAQRRPRAAGRGRAAAEAPATSSSRRTTATWWTAGSSARRPSCSSTWRWAAASSRATSSRLGEVLSPALRVARSREPGAARRPTSARCCARPATSTSSSRRSSALVDRPEIAAALGRNARQAVLDTIPGSGTSRTIWRFVREHLSEADVARAAVERVETGDAYKEQVQDQWNNNPVGSHYATATEPHTLRMVPGGRSAPLRRRTRRGCRR